MKTAILLSTLFLFSLPASARIGETLEQCRARYGPEHPELERSSGNDLSEAIDVANVAETPVKRGPGRPRKSETE